MTKKIGKFLGTAISTLLLVVAAWYFFLTGIIAQANKATVQGVAAPSLSREQGQEALRHHGVKVAYVKGGYWYFKRNGEECRLIPGE